MSKLAIGKSVPCIHAPWAYHILISQRLCHIACQLDGHLFPSLWSPCRRRCNWRRCDTMGGWALRYDRLGGWALRYDRLSVSTARCRPVWRLGPCCRCFVLCRLPYQHHHRWMQLHISSHVRSSSSIELRQVIQRSGCYLIYGQLHTGLG